MSCLKYVHLSGHDLQLANKFGYQTFKKRAADIADHAHNPRGALGEGADFLRGLDEMERQLFRAAHDSTKAMKNWTAELKKS
jgi:GINS complex subunit 3